MGNRKAEPENLRPKRQTHGRLYHRDQPAQATARNTRPARNPTGVQMVPAQTRFCFRVSGHTGETRGEQRSQRSASDGPEAGRAEKDRRCTRVGWYLSDVASSSGRGRSLQGITIRSADRRRCGMSNETLSKSDPDSEQAEEPFSWRLRNR